jgi:O-antigen/teichoic acid export membrane protein/glycosyltransferase involved in cell wall biosynthesis
MVDSWRSAGIMSVVDADFVFGPAWDSPLPLQLLQTLRCYLQVLWRLIRPSGRPALIHLNASTGGNIYRDLLMTLTCSVFRVPTVVHLHSGAFSPWLAASHRNRWAFRALLSRAALVIVTAGIWKGPALEAGARRIAVVPHMLSPSLEYSMARQPISSPLDADPLRLLYYGRWNEAKGIDRLADALRALPPEVQEGTTLRLFGNGKRSWVEELFAELPSHTVHIGGWLDEGDLANELAHTDVLLVPSRQEAFGQVLLEGMAAGRVIVASDAGAIPEVLATYPLAKITPAGDVQALARAIEDMQKGRWPPPGEHFKQPAVLPGRFRNDVVLRQLHGTYMSVLHEPDTPPAAGDSPSRAPRAAFARRVHAKFAGHFARAAAGVLALQIFSRFFAFLTTLLAARLLGAESFGSYAYAITWANILAVLSVIGFDRFAVRTVAVYSSRRQWGELKGFFRFSTGAVLAAGICLSLGAAITGAATLSSPLREPFVLAMAIAPLTALIQLRQGVLQGLHRSVQSLFPYLLTWPLLFFLFTAVAAVVNPGGLTGTTIVGFNLASTALALGLAITLSRRAEPVPSRSGKPSYEPREWLRGALPLAAIASILVANNQLGVILVGAFKGAESVGIYSIGLRLSEVMVFISVAVITPLAPMAARLHEEGRLGRLQELTTRSVRVAAIGSGAIALILIAGRAFWLGIFGPDFESASLSLVILVIAQFSSAVAGPAEILLMMTGHGRSAAIGFAGGLLLNAVVGLILVPAMGIEGAALAQLASTLLWNTMIVWMTWRLLGVNATVFARPPARVA